MASNTIFNIMNIARINSYLIAIYGRRANARRTITKMKEYFKQHCKPKGILSDHGSQFTSNLWTEFLEENEIKQHFSSIKHPQSNVVKRYNKTIVQLLRIYINSKHTKWPEYIQHIMSAINNSVNESSGYKPILL